jgi:AraC-like DNA-binding protein
MHSHDQYIKANHLKISANDIAKEISKSPTYVRNRYKVLGIKIPAALSQEFRSRKAALRSLFTKEDDQYLRDNYLTTPIKAISRELGHSSYATFNRLKRLGLEVPKEIALSRKRNNLFKPGHIPKNKGKAAKDWMTPEQLKNFKKTQFKKGNEPHNTLADGDIRYREDKTGAVYQYIRISKGNWELLQREVYRKEIGPLKDNEVVTFKDCNTLNCIPENLEKITNKELMLRNSIHRYGPEISKAQFLFKKIERKISSKPQPTNK